jgi:hypothetical protein
LHSHVSPVAHNAILYKYKLYMTWHFPCQYSILSIQKLSKDINEGICMSQKRANADIITKTTNNLFSWPSEVILFSIRIRNVNTYRIHLQVNITIPSCITPFTCHAQKGRILLRSLQGSMSCREILRIKAIQM